MPKNTPACAESPSDTLMLYSCVNMVVGWIVLHFKVIVRVWRVFCGWIVVYLAPHIYLITAVVEVMIHSFSFMSCSTPVSIVPISSLCTQMAVCRNVISQDCLLIWSNFTTFARLMEYSLRSVWDFHTKKSIFFERQTLTVAVSFPSPALVTKNAPVDQPIDHLVNVELRVPSPRHIKAYSCPDLRAGELALLRLLVLALSGIAMAAGLAS